MNAYADAALDLMDPECGGVVPGDTVPVGRAVRPLSDQLREVKRLRTELAERTRERDDLADLVGTAIVQVSLAPGESLAVDPEHALTEGIGQLRRQHSLDLLRLGAAHAQDLQILQDSDAELAERTRDRDDARRMYCVATALHGTDAITCDDVGLLRSIAASTWCGAEARRLYPEEPQP